MLKVGLTGSIAVGKSYVCDIFRELGAVVLDADVTAREVVAKDSIGLRLITKEFGEGILDSEGSLDRTKMGELIFADGNKRQLLNSIVHPLVYEKQNEWLEQIAEENLNVIAIIDAALMIETGGYKRFDKLIVVFCDLDVQLQRLMLRNELTQSDALRRINAQMPQEEKKLFADFLIDTTNGYDPAKAQTIEVYEQLKLFII